MAKVYYINGMLCNHARKICEFYFGDYFHSLELNEKNRTFDIYLKKELTIDKQVKDIESMIDMSYFKEFWGPQWRLMYIKEEIV